MTLKIKVIYTKRQGSVSTAFLAVIVPLFIGITTIVVSLNEYFYELENEQKFLDSALILGLQGLPDKKLAEEKIATYLKKRSNYFENLNVDFSGGVVTAQILGSKKIPLFSYFSETFLLPVNIQAVARSIPQNISLIIDESSYLAPSEDSDELWDSINWSSSQYISNNFEELELNMLAKSPENLTQKCFNPIYSNLKLTALEILNFAQSNALNNLAVAFAPNEGSSIEILNFTGSGYEDYRKNLEFTSNKYCALSAQNENYIYKYRFPKTNSNIEKIIDPISLEYNKYYDSYLLPEEIIWSRSASFSNRVMDINAVFNFLYLSVSKVISPNSNNKIFILAGDLPQTQLYRFPDNKIKSIIRSGIKNLSILSYTTKAELKINYYIFKNDFSNLIDEDNILELQEYFNELQKEFQSKTKIAVRLIDSKKDYNKIVMKALIDEQVGLIAR